MKLCHFPVYGLPHAKVQEIKKDHQGCNKTNDTISLDTEVVNIYWCK